MSLTMAPQNKVQIIGPSGESVSYSTRDIKLLLSIVGEPEALDVYNDVFSQLLYFNRKQTHIGNYLSTKILVRKARNMAAERPALGLRTTSLPRINADDADATESPARGREMRNRLLQTLRPPPFVHVWDFWHEKQQPSGNADNTYADRLNHMATVADIKEFWQIFNNFDFGTMGRGQSFHLFHQHVKPLWEDPRNEKGGAWNFKVEKEKAPQFFKEIALLAVGETLQQAVDTPKRQTFIDDICGVSFSVKWSSILIAIWNRDASNEEGKEKIKAVVLDGLSAELLPPREVYYKAHAAHNGFTKK